MKATSNWLIPLLLFCLSYTSASAQSDLTIICDELSNEDKGSAYLPYTFRYELPEGISVTNIKWTFSLKDKNNNKVEIATANSAQFTITPITNPDDYLIADSNLSGEVSLRYDINGDQPKILTYKLSLDLKPIITSVSNIQVIEKPALNSRSFICDATYYGCDYIVALIEEDFSSDVLTYYIRQSPTAHIELNHITLHYTAWIDLKVSNQYGSAIWTSELKPVLDSGIGEIPATPSPMSVYNLNGLHIGTFDSVESMKTNLPKGIYIVKTQSHNGSVETKKITL